MACGGGGTGGAEGQEEEEEQEGGRGAGGGEVESCNNCVEWVRRMCAFVGARWGWGVCECMRESGALSLPTARIPSFTTSLSRVSVV